MTISNGIVHAFLALRAGQMYYKHLHPNKPLHPILEVQPLLDMIVNTLQRTSGQLNDHYLRVVALLEAEQTELETRALLNIGTGASVFQHVDHDGMSTFPFDISMFIDSWGEWPLREVDQ